ncbi:unnamed protein product [Adineta steineri]|uniref:Uncharacterized protein n=1 Tax=Adineta steineri TaxID=433720 RepID=A0A814A7E0_9BILA|nr:unnamed protein product [Adineta steineri]CAF0841261.1 unnamed protein product [Adineta steineri]CAF0910717.1 unnamed protein product [Adineta steineri]
MLKSIILALLFLGVAVNAKITQEDITAIKESLTAAVQADNQCTTAADCTAAAVGSRACGGPSSYVVYSAECANAEQISSLIQLATRLEKQFNTENEMMSICSMIMPPKALCVANKCKAAAAFESFEPMH